MAIIIPGALICHSIKSFAYSNGYKVSVFSLVRPDHNSSRKTGLNARTDTLQLLALAGINLIKESGTAGRPKDSEWN